MICVVSLVSDSEAFCKYLFTKMQIEFQSGVYGRPRWAVWRVNLCIVLSYGAFMALPVFSLGLIDLACLKQQYVCRFLPILR